VADADAPTERYTWEAFDGFDRPRRAASWAVLTEFVHRGQRFAAERCQAFPGLLQQWDGHLEDLDGDPSRADWTAFRPLRADREEHWSDWLQHFIATSMSGAFSHQIFGRNSFAAAGECAQPRVLREDTAEARRADLVIQWRGALHTHLEVKVGDQSFAKTIETAESLERKYPRNAWTHYILLPLEDVARWSATSGTEESGIHVITWDDVATALRRSLRRHDESRHWLTWSHGFCGLVEQKLLGHPRATDRAESLGRMERRMRQMSIMERGLKDV
jgi:hypothetical protein